MIVGIFHPVINWCGGAEWVAINVINTLKEHGHQTVIMTDKRVNQGKIDKVYGKKLKVDTQIIFPLNFAPPGHIRNIYTHILRVMMLKHKCNILVDTISNAVLPYTDFTYIHYPFLKRPEIATVGNRIYYHPYCTLTRAINTETKLFCANSEFTSKAINEVMGVKPHVLYPPISTSFFKEKTHLNNDRRQNTVVTLSRISPRKRLDMIPHLAKQTRKNISFQIIGLLDSPEAIPYLHSLKKTITKLKVADRIKIITDVNRFQLRDLLQTSKVYFHPTIDEHFGISIIEAMASGCVPIVNDSGGPKETVPFNLRYKDMNEAVSKIEKAIFEWTPSYSNKISSIAENFSEEKFSERFMRLFNMTCDIKRSH